ncbi:hypothetical protein IT397_02185 [Candidatus Nomurabacteria bacterium]|nr:hypothetical protein [Candidatus Nomurabacteria bacterium]
MSNILLESLQQALVEVSKTVGNFAPKLVLAVVVFLLGWIIAIGISTLVAQIIKFVRLDNLLKMASLEEVTKRAGINLNSGRFLGELVRWFLVIIVLMASFEILGLVQVNDFLKTGVLPYIPQVIAAVLILLVSVVIADFMRKVVSGAAQAAGVKSSAFLGSVAKWAIWIFAILAALVQLQIAVSIINILFTGVVVALALALGLSFGLGGQEAAAKYLAKLGNEISDKN